MNNYVLFTDSTCDLPYKLADQLHIQVIPMEFLIGDQVYHHYLDGREMSMKAFYDGLRNGSMPTTTQINQTVYFELFEPFLADGQRYSISLLQLRAERNVSVFQAGRAGAINVVSRSKDLYGRHTLCLRWGRRHRV